MTNIMYCKSLLLDAYDDQPPILFHHLGKDQGALGGNVVSNYHIFGFFMALNNMSH